MDNLKNKTIQMKSPKTSDKQTNKIENLFDGDLFDSSHDNTSRTLKTSPQRTKSIKNNLDLSETETKVLIYLQKQHRETRK